ncbi:hypothetical protein [Ruegeria intermedia]|uniref:hypothetical protein n=1 Tax=Ruegeria intermedia TaxID=996115 RepID=UPI00122C5543|nr:hypothetical protein [Ruegeria intermedia]
MTQIRDNPDQFIEHTIPQLFSLAPNGKLAREALAIRNQMTTARQRANRLDIVTPEKIAAVVRQIAPDAQKAEPSATRRSLPKAWSPQSSSAARTMLWEATGSAKSVFRPETSRDRNGEANPAEA